MSLRVWDERVVPRLTDLSLRGHEVGEMREKACAGLTGRVLEIGFGSGLNIRWYPPEVTSVTAIEPSDLGWQLSERRRARSALTVERAGLDGQRLDLADDSHDSALITFSLCTIPDPLLALREARRVVRPGGLLHVLEHGLAPDESVRRWQRRMEPLQRAVAGGCHLTRDIPSLVEETGWRIEHSEQAYLPGPAASRPWTYGYRLVAG
jgi:ubiquinone/menaquinone biosynthesis C-methylase UbiE